MQDTIKQIIKRVKELHEKFENEHDLKAQKLLNELNKIYFANSIMPIITELEKERASGARLTEVALMANVKRRESQAELEALSGGLKLAIEQLCKIPISRPVETALACECADTYEKLAERFPAVLSPTKEK